jgi:putative transposase
MMQRSYERHLPHQVPEGHPIFLTWNLKGALPTEVIEMFRQARERLEQEPIRAGETSAQRKLRHDKFIFGMSDRYLDRADKGPLDLKDPANAKLVEDSILFGVPDRYDLFAWCVMANHVHVLLQPRWELKKITQGLKGYTAHEINSLQGQRGRVFWQDESYDHWAREEAEVLRIIEYLENNPMVAGLCSRPEDWPYSSARLREHWPRGQPFRK